MDLGTGVFPRQQSSLPLACSPCLQYPVAPKSSLVSGFLKVVRQHPHRLAIRDGDAHLTYLELAQRVNELARRIFLADPPIDRPVAICALQGIEFVVCMLAVMRSGRFWMPLDPLAPSARNRKVWADSLADVALASKATVKLARDFIPASRLICIDEREKQVVDELPPLPKASDIAFILYTSGSTGIPKGVVHTHRSFLHNVRRHTESFGITPSDRCSLLYPTTVYGGIRDILNGLLSGASLHHYPIQRLGTMRLGSFIAEQRLTIYCSVATIFRQLVQTLGHRRLPDLRIVKLGGEAVRRTDFAAFQAHFSTECKLSCGLAATEVGSVRQYFLTPQDTVVHSRVLCGHAVPDMEVLIVDQHGVPVESGDPGEIAIRSEFLASGYWRRPDLTETVFFQDGAGRRIYRMGDLGRIQEDGQLIHLGRRDRQVKVHGNRVEVSEIEVCLLDHPDVRDVAVKPSIDDHGHAVLSAFVVLDDESHTLEDPSRQLREHVGKHLPAFMVPNSFTLLERLPMLPHGKTDFAALRVSSYPDQPIVRAANLSDSEERLLGIWRKVLSRPMMGPDDDFFMSGGNSLKLFEMLFQAERVWQKMIPVPLIAATPTARTFAAAMAGQALHIERRQHVEFELAIVPLRTNGSRPPLYLVTPAGGSVIPYLGLVRSLDVDRPVYGLVVNVKRRAKLPQQALEKVATALIGMLRETTSFPLLTLGGWSFGGFVAHEIARQLAQDGFVTRPVVVIDSQRDMLEEDLRSYLRGLGLMGRLVVQGLPFLRETLRLRLRFWRRQNESAHPRILSVVPSVPNLLWQFPNYIRMLRKSHPKASTVNVELFQNPLGSRAVINVKQWESITSGSVRTHAISGDHFSLMLPPHVAHLGAQLNQCLDWSDSANEDSPGDSPRAFLEAG